LPEFNLGYIVTEALSFFSVLIGLALVGVGIGFTMGTPLNYLILQNATKNESTSALAAMSLMRSIGTTMSPNILIGFITQSAANLQPRLMELVQKNMPSAAPGMHMPSSIFASEKKR
jgi:MFS family permease